MGDRDWLTVTEAAERSGYSREHVQRLARENIEKPELAQNVRVDKTSDRGYLIYWPSLVAYMAEIRHGPRS